MGRNFLLQAFFSEPTKGFVQDKQNGVCLCVCGEVGKALRNAFFLRKKAAHETSDGSPPTGTGLGEQLVAKSYGKDVRCLKLFHAGNSCLRFAVGGGGLDGLGGLFCPEQQSERDEQ